MRLLRFGCIVLSLTVLLSTCAGTNGASFSPQVNADRTVTLRLRADDATVVTAAGDIGEIVLTKDAHGVWSGTTASLAPAIYSYSFIVDGTRRADPENPDAKGVAESLVTVPGDPPKPWEPRPVPRGRVIPVSYQSETFGAERRYFVYTPPGYETARDGLPVLYLLHGYTDDDSTWTAVGKADIIADNLLAEGTIKPLLIVMPYGQLNGSVPPDQALGIDFQRKFERQLFTEIIPAVEKTYRAVPDAGHRAVAGLSMGGMQAAFIGLNHPETFSTVAMWSSAVFIDPSVLLSGLAAAPENLKRSFLYVQVAVGQQDDLYARSGMIDRFLASHDITHKFTPTPGTHNWVLWRGYLVDFLPKFSAVAQ